MRFLLLAALATTPFLAASRGDKSTTDPAVKDTTEGAQDAAGDAAKAADEVKHESGSGAGDGTGVGGGKGGGEHHK